jgi:hypothetical protein
LFVSSAEHITTDKAPQATDILFSRRLAQRQGELLTKFVRWYTPAEH